MAESQVFRDSRRQRTSESETDDSLSKDFSEDEHLLEKEGLPDTREPRRNRNRWRWIWAGVTTLNVAVLCSTILLFISGRQSCSAGSYVEKLKETQKYTPVYETFEPSSHDVTANGTLFNYPRNIFRNDPSHEVDLEWNLISPNSWLLFTREQIIELGKDPATRAKASPELLKELGYAEGSEMFYGWIDAFHQTHCLNVIRKHSYWDHYYRPHYGNWDNAHELHWTHLSHCLDVIRQNLQCNANADIITHVWKEGQEGPYPDFSINKKCGNFEGLQEWQINAMVPDELVDKYVVRPADEDIEHLYPAEQELFLLKEVPIPEGHTFEHEAVIPENFFSSW